MNLEDLVSWLRCNQNLSDTKVYEFCGIMGCHGMKCSACREEAVKEAADAIETLLAEREAAVTVVRCKDCKHCILTGRPPFMFRACNRNDAIRTVGEDDFCKYGTPPDREDGGVR